VDPRGDTGPGPAEKAREHLFTAFQGGARKGGVGLGLAIAAELVRGHGGRLELCRSDAEGTEFRIRLPAGQLRPEACGAPTTPPCKAPDGGDRYTPPTRP
jgi:signal transduction histidine kinase